MIGLPDNVSWYTDRHGKRRYRFRKIGLPTGNFKSVPGTPEFEAELLQFQIGAVVSRRVAVNAKRRIIHAPPDGDSYVYFIGAERGPVKIGYSTSVRRRLKMLRCASSAHLRLLAIAPGGKDLEAYYHARFSDSRCRGEWFDRTPELKAEVRRLANQSKVSQT